MKFLSAVRDGVRVTGRLVEKQSPLFSWRRSFELTSTLPMAATEISDGVHANSGEARRLILGKVLQPGAVASLGDTCTVTWKLASEGVSGASSPSDSGILTFANIASVTVFLTDGMVDVGVFAPSLEDSAFDDGVNVMPSAAGILARVGVETSGPPPSYPLGESRRQLTPDDIEYFRGLVDASWKAACTRGCWHDDQGYDLGTNSAGDFKMVLDASVVQARCPILWTGLVSGEEEPLVLLRRTDAKLLTPGPMWIPWHTDVTASRTVQIPLSCGSECQGGRFTYVCDGSIHVHPREIGVPTLHHASLVHAVTALTLGVRYSMFLLF
jgi:hypothetical protein